MYTSIFTALVKNDFSQLEGTLAGGQSAPVEPVIVKAPEAKAQEPVKTEAPKPAAPANVVEAQFKAEVTDETKQLAEAIARIMRQQMPAAKVEVNEDTIKRIVNDAMCDQRSDMAEHAVGLAKQVKEQVDQHLAKIPPRDIIEIRKHDGTTKELTGLRHKQFGDIIKFTTARASSGFVPPLWLYGSPGAGKTHLCQQIAEALELPYYPVPLGPTSTESKLLGYNNLATGGFVKGALFEPYLNGGVVGMDEIDVADPSVLVGCNAIASNDRFRFPNGDTVMKHKDFILVAGANTIGTGATAGYTRNRLDAATLDRFVKLRLEYDAELEAKLCGNQKWAEYVWKVREYVTKHCNGSIYITPRASINGAALLANGLPADMVAESTLFTLCSADTKQAIIKSVGQFNK